MDKHPKVQPWGFLKGFWGSVHWLKLCSKNPCLGEVHEILPAAGMIWQQKLSYTHWRDSSSSPVYLGHSQCHCSPAAPVTHTWGMKSAVERSISCLQACLGWMHSGVHITAPVYLPQTWTDMSDLWNVGTVQPYGSFQIVSNVEQQTVKPWCWYSWSAHLFSYKIREHTHTRTRIFTCNMYIYIYI